jgi:predicted MFS family arabinose efflux permease
MLALSVPVVVWDLTESVRWVGTAAAAAQLPSFIGSPLGGVWADRHSKRVVLLLALLAQVALAFSLYRASTSESLGLATLLGLTAANGLASSVNLSAYQALVAEIVPERQVRSAYKLNAIQFNASRAIGPAIAGWVLASAGAPTAFLINALAHLPLVLALLSIRPHPRPRPPSTHVIRAIVEAAGVTWRIPALRTSLLTITVTSAFGMSVQQLAKGLTEQVYGVDDAGLGMLVASIGVAAVVTAIGTAMLGDAIRGSSLVRWGLVIYGLGLWVVAWTADFAIAGVGFAITGFAHVLVNVSVTTAIQSQVPNAYRGRVTSLQMMAIILSMAFGAQLGGVLGDLQGLPRVVAGYGTALIVFAIWGHWRMDRMQALD